MVFKEEPPAALYLKEECVTVDEEEEEQVADSDEDEYVDSTNSITCKTCGDLFLSTTDYNSHVFNDSLGFFVCCKCGSKFVDEKTIRQHMRDHTLQKNIVLLPNKAKQITDLAKSGKLIDSRINDKFICKYCDQDFSERGDFYNHYMSHVKETKKPPPPVPVVKYNGRPIRDDFKVERLYLELAWKCKKCGRGFNTAPKQRKHMKTCPGKEEWCCPGCRYLFKRSGDMFVHYDIAHRALNRMCKFCLSIYPNEKRVVKHILEKHLDYTHYCFDCSEGFLNSATYESHCRLHV